MNLLVVKLIVTPLLILVCSLAGRRWGEAISGWLVGLPLTSGPVAVFLAIEQGPQFVAQSSAGSLAGVIAQACFCIAYSTLAVRGWPAAVLAGSLAFLACAAILQWAELTHLALLLLGFASLGVTIYVLPKSHIIRSETVHPWWDIPARMAIATGLVVGLTSLAAVLGPRVSGVLATFPIFVIILTVFAHRLQGPGAGMEVLRGMATALFGFAVFFYVLSFAIVATSVALAFAAATICALTIQTTSLQFIQRPNAPAPERGGIS
jgi:hypothetical protein